MCISRPCASDFDEGLWGRRGPDSRRFLTRSILQGTNPAAAHAGGTDAAADG